MSYLEYLILILMSYLLTGVALTGYDFSAPPLHRKSYVVKKKYSTAIIIWFIWPITSFIDAKMERMMGRSYFKHFWGIFLVAIGMFLWAGVAYLFFSMFINLDIICFILTGAVMLFCSPLLTGLAMPPYRSK